MRASQYSRSFSVWAATLRALLAAPVLGEEGLERGPDVLLALDEDGLEVVRVEAAEDVQHRALVVARAERLDLAVAEQVAHLRQLLGRSEGSGIVRVEVVAVRAVEGVDVPQRRVVARLDGVGVRAGELPFTPLADGAAFVEPDADADRTVTLALGEPVGLDLAEGLALQVGELQVLEHNVDQLLQRDVGLVVVAAGLVPGLVLALAGLLGLADHLAGLGLAVPLAAARGVLAVAE